MSSPSLYNLSPLLSLLSVGAALALLPLAGLWWRQRRSSPAQRLRALTLLTLFLTFDLVLFGAFTRLTDSGLGCPDWPGCYAHASPVGAGAEIAAAQSAMPSGPVTLGKAWIEMIHRYLATGVGALIVVLLVLAWRGRVGRLGWPVVTLVWVCIQGAFGALTVTMKLFPAIVTLHLLGGYGLLALLAVQTVRLSRPAVLAVELPAVFRLGIALALGWLVLQVASGAWVSSNYAVLVCTDFPQCQGQWWPTMTFEHGFEVWRPLGQRADGATLTFQDLTAIHVVHRLLAGLTVLVLGTLAWRLRSFPALRQPVRWLTALLGLQVLTGISNVVLDWPLAGAVLHTGGAGALVVILVWLLAATQTPLERTL
jgi:cytochrome c oxidase assembly protein subunit 15